MTDTAEAIVRRLAVSNPLGGDMHYDALICKHCGAVHPEPHRDGCVFWAAVQWADQHPAQ